MRTASRLLLTLIALLAVTVPAAPAAAQSGTIDVTRFPSNGGLVTDDANEISCGNDCSGTYAYECEPNDNPPPAEFCFPQSIVLTSAPGNGYSPNGWTGCPGSTTSSCTVSASGTKSVTANFLDTAPPSITFPGADGKRRGLVSVTTAPSDNSGFVVAVDFFVNSGLVYTDTVAPFGHQFDTTILPDGTHTFGVRARDAAGNASAVSTRTVIVDNTVAGVFDSPTPTAGSTTAATGIAIAFHGASPGDTFGFECALDGGSYAPCTSPWSPALGDGDHTVVVKITDDIGNVVTLGRTFKVDRTAPALTVTGPSGMLNAASVTAAFSVSDAGGSATEVDCSLDGSAYGSCDAIPVTEGAHTLTVRARDNVQNSATQATQFTIDRTLPEISITTATVSEARAEIEWTATDATAMSFTCSLDGAAAVPCTSPIQFAALSVGDHTVTVRAQDAAGNARSVQRTFKIVAAVTPTPSAPGPDSTGPAAKPVLTVSRKASLGKIRRRLRVSVTTPDVAGCRLQLRRGRRVLASRAAPRGRRATVIVRLKRSIRPGTYTVRLVCGARSASRTVKLTR